VTDEQAEEILRGSGRPASEHEHFGDTAQSADESVPQGAPLDKKKKRRNRKKNAQSREPETTEPTATPDTQKEPESTNSANEPLADEPSEASRSTTPPHKQDDNLQSDPVSNNVHARSGTSNTSHSANTPVDSQCDKSPEANVSEPLGQDPSPQHDSAPDRASLPGTSDASVAAQASDSEPKEQSTEANDDSALPSDSATVQSDTTTEHRDKEEDKDDVKVVWSKYISKRLYIKYETDRSSMTLAELEQLQEQSDMDEYDHHYTAPERQLWDDESLPRDVIRRLIRFR
jgi:hypothetical protein